MHVILEEGKQMNQGSDKALRWPVLIGLSIILIFIAAVATVVIAVKNPVQDSDLFMRNYHDTDANINIIIEQKIAFDKKYTINYVTEQFKAENATLIYKLTDKEGNAVNDATFDVIITRPNVHEFDMRLKAPSVNNGIYTFENITLPKEGRWDIMAKVTVADTIRYYNLKADTRYSTTFEY